MTDPYENIRKALAMGPTPGPWRLYRRDDWHGPIVQRGKQGGFVVQGLSPAAEDADAAHIAACDPDTIRELLAERDALARDAERLDWLAEGFRTCTVYMGGDHPWTPGHKVRSLHGPSFRAAIDQARGKEDGNG